MMVFEIENEEQSKLVQMKLFSMGYQWNSAKKEPSYLSKPIILTINKNIYFNGHMSPKYLYHIIDVNSFLGTIPEEMFTL